MSEQKTHVIWKYPLQMIDLQILSLPKGAEFRLLADQNGVLTLWYEVDPEAEKEERQIVIAGTGNPLPAGLTHLGSVIQNAFVWHVYSVRRIFGVGRNSMNGLRPRMPGYRLYPSSP